MTPELATRTELLERLDRLLLSANQRVFETLEQIAAARTSWRDHQQHIIAPGRAATERLLRANQDAEVEGAEVGEELRDLSRGVVTMLSDSLDQRLRIRRTIVGATETMIAVGEDLASAEALMSVGGGDQHQLEHVQAVRARVGRAVEDLRTAGDAVRDIDVYLAAAHAYLSGPVAASPEVTRSLGVGAEVRLNDADREIERAVTSTLRETDRDVSVIGNQVRGAQSEVERSLTDLTEEVRIGVASRPTEGASGLLVLDEAEQAAFVRNLREFAVAQTSFGDRARLADEVEQTGRLDLTVERNRAIVQEAGKGVALRLPEGASGLVVLDTAERAAFGRNLREFAEAQTGFGDRTHLAYEVEQTGRLDLTKARNQEIVRDLVTDVGWKVGGSQFLEPPHEMRRVVLASQRLSTEAPVPRTHPATTPGDPRRQDVVRPADRHGPTQSM